MFYEEKILDGVLCYRTSLDCLFVKLSSEQLTTKLQLLKQENDALRRAISVLEKEIE